ncbi:DUF58 domain-containing protein [Thermohalobacter berrensis]|uniref:DUF58 domain-containing protein n=1 Tax=Thermohalobacter berrensis TaxID=99594 RepID=A0A419SZH8_9FIRM|nr:DUF58 domain-containing protein [Thermohalobacter berrensis]RKD30551.1 hypothetical protein BET03_04225 [Thermohalobacter berrensis]
MANSKINISLLKKLETLKLNSNFILNKGYSGSRKSKAKGSSIEFSDYREYVPGDDFRKIDWNAYGRFQKLFVKLFMEEREASINIFLDTSKSMAFGSPKKSYIALNLSMVFAYLSLANLDRINLYTINNGKLDNTGYLKGKNMTSRVINFLEKVKFESREDMLNLIPENQYKQGISIIISDLFSDNFEEVIKYLSYLKQNIIVLQILSKEELNPTIRGDVKLIDSETENEIDISGSNSILKAYEKNLNKFLNNINEICKKYGCYYTFLSNETPLEKIIFDSLIKAGILR